MGGTTTTIHTQHQPLTYPILTWKEILDVFRDAGVPLTPSETTNPTPQTVMRVSHALLELVTGVPREEVAEAIARQLDTMDNAELFREALPQLVLFREMERMVGAAQGEFTWNDLLQPTSARLQRMTSAVFNFGRFREDVLRQHAEQQQELTNLLQEIQNSAEKLQEVTAQIKAARERQMKDAPERARVEEELARGETELRGLGNERVVVEQRVDEEKRKTEQIRKQCDAMAFEIVAVNAEADDIKSKMVTSPERIQGELRATRKRLEQEKEEVERLEEEARVLRLKANNLKNAQAIGETCVAQLSEVEAQAAKAKQAEEEMHARRTAIDSHSYTLRELAQREQEAQREADLAEDRYKRQSQQRAAKLEAAKQKLKQAQRDRDAYDRNLDEANRRATRAKAQVTAARADYMQIKSLGEERLHELQDLLTGFLSTFEMYAKGVEEAAHDLRRAVTTSTTTATINGSSSGMMDGLEAA
jgi:kinetochore protein Nuf2